MASNSKVRREDRRPEDADRLGVRPARLIRRSGEQAAELQGALRVLYRDYLVGGGLDCLRESSCRGRPNAPERQGKQ